MCSPSWVLCRLRITCIAVTAPASLVASPLGRCGCSSRRLAPPSARHPSRLLAAARPRRCVITASASARYAGHILSRASASSAGKWNRFPAQAGQPGREPAILSSTGEPSRSTGPKACWTMSVIAPSPMSSHCGDTPARWPGPARNRPPDLRPGPVPCPAWPGPGTGPRSPRRDARHRSSPRRRPLRRARPLSSFPDRWPARPAPSRADRRRARIETAVNSPDGLGAARRLPNLPGLQARARAVNTRLLHTEKVGRGRLS